MADNTSTTPNWPIGALIGFGHYWHTYEDPTDPEKVVKISASPDPGASGFSATETLINIMHLVFPKNIPQVCEAGVRTDGVRQLRVDKVHFHPQYARMVELKNTASLTDAERAELAELRREHNKWVDTNETAQHLFKQLDSVGISFDYATMFNTVRDRNDTPVYIDELYLKVTPEEFGEKIFPLVDQSSHEEVKKLIEQYRLLVQASAL